MPAPASTVSVQQLSEQTADVLARVESGERVRVVDERHRVVAELAPTADEKRTWVTREELLESFAQTDPGLHDDLRTLYRDTLVEG